LTAPITWDALPVSNNSGPEDIATSAWSIKHVIELAPLGGRGDDIVQLQQFVVEENQ
jgi:hypothetical protein